MEPQGYHSFWAFCTTRKGYSGTMCLSRWKPLNVLYGMGDDCFDTEGRILTLEFEEFFFVNCYVPNSQRSERRYDYRSQWDVRFVQYLSRLKHQKSTIVCGDFNVIASDADVYYENQRARQESEGFQSTERENLIDIVGSGFVDTYRLVHPNEDCKFTWWSNRRFKRKDNRGWRLDYFLVSEELRHQVVESTMLTDVYGSDHCPILLEMDWAVGGTDKGVQPVLPDASYTYSDLIELENDHFAFHHVRQTDMTALWNSVDWEQAGKHLEEMQIALAKSAHTRDNRLIAKWQRRIVTSLDARLLAVRHTCDASGGSGVDCIKWETPHEKMAAALSLTAKDYRAMPSRLLIVTSKKGKERRIHIDTYYDRAMQCLYSYALDPIAESWGDRKSFAYRKGRSAYDMNEYIKLGLSGSDAPEWVLIADIRRCYENISHEWILEHIPMPGHVMRQFLSAGYVFGGELFPTDSGVGIGCSISPIVANMALDGLQNYVYSRLYPEGAEIDYADGNMIRYADDLLFMARTEESARRIQAYTTEFLEERGLMLAPEKCKIVHISEGFTFMSRAYYKTGTQVLARPSDAAIERFMGSVRETIENYTGSQKTLIVKLNRLIDGWTTYHKVGEADIAFRQMDVYISALLLKLCESKHPKWSREKILQRYWYVDAEGRHCYALPNKKEERVKFLSDTLLVDYYSVRTRMNPYIDLEYMRHRTRERQILNVSGVYRTIWNRQNGKCHYCGHTILRDEEKVLLEVYPEKSRFASRMAYVHKRCLQCSVDYVDSASLPASLTDVMELLEELESGRKPVAQKYFALSEYFRICQKNSLTLTFREIETILGDELGASARRKEFWYRTGFLCISQCWLDNGYEIKNLCMEGRRRVTFVRTENCRNTASVLIPEIIRYGRVPDDAKYELENYFRYIVKKYGL